MEKLIEAAEERFVFRAHAADNGVETRLHLRGVFVFEVVVDEDDHGERERFGGEDLDALFDVVLEDAKFVFAKVGHEVAGAILDGNGENDEAGIDGDPGLGVTQGRGLRLSRWRLRRGAGLLSGLERMLSSPAPYEQGGHRNEQGTSTQGDFS